MHSVIYPSLKSPTDSSEEASFISKEVTNDLVKLFLTIVAVGVYLIISRRFLRSLDLPCPSIRQSLPAWPIGIIAYLFWRTGITIIDNSFPVGSKNEVSSLLYFVGVTLLTIAVYKYGVGLFVRQEINAKPIAAAEMPIAPVDSDASGFPLSRE